MTASFQDVRGHAIIDAMTYRLIDADPEAADVRSLTFVPFLAHGTCVAIPRKDGTFLDLGCANGLLMESVQEWAGERGMRSNRMGSTSVPASSTSPAAGCWRATTADGRRGSTSTSCACRSPAPPG